MDQDEFKEYQPGEIYFFSESHDDARHPFAIVGRFDEQYYLGCMITHGDSEKWPDNIPMELEDFEREFEQGREAKVVYSENRGTGSHFVRVTLLKEVDLAVKWSGQLSSRGLEKMRKAIEGLEPEMWRQYKVNSAKRLKTSKGKK